MQGIKTYCPNCDWTGDSDDIFCQQCGSKMERRLPKNKIEAVSPGISSTTNLNSRKDDDTPDLVQNESEIPLPVLIISISSLVLIMIAGMVIIASILTSGNATDYSFFLVIGLVAIPFVGISTIENVIKRAYPKKRRKKSFKFDWQKDD